MIVVDASVAAKWFLTEAGSEAARALLTSPDERIHGPDLLLIEVTGVFVRLANQREISREDASIVIGRLNTAWQLGQVQSHRVDDQLVMRSAAIALELGHPLKDCIYLALALELGCPLLTADARFRDRAAERYPAIELLG